jgi:hypothetical protein
LYTALQKWLILEDEITGEEVKVQLRYERLPNFCLFCGFIGHMEARCDLHPTARKLNFSQDLRVPAVHFDDPRAWFLAEDMGRPRNQGRLEASNLWRATAPTASSPDQNIVVATVADDVAKLSMSYDKNMTVGKLAPATVATTTTNTTAEAVECDVILKASKHTEAGGSTVAIDKIVSATADELGYSVAEDAA